MRNLYIIGDIVKLMKKHRNNTGINSMAES